VTAQRFSDGSIRQVWGFKNHFIYVCALNVQTNYAYVGTRAQVDEEFVDMIVRVRVCKYIHI